MGNQGDIGDKEVRLILAAKMPGYPIESVVWLGEGLDNVAYEINGELIVRFSTADDPAVRVALEAGVLRAVADISPLPVPKPAFTAAEQGCFAYYKIPGVPLLDLPRRQLATHAMSIAATLGGLLTALHAAQVDRMANLVGVDDQPLVEWRDEAAEIYANLAADIPAVHRKRIAAFLSAPPPGDGYAPVFSHNDLGIEHVLVDPAAWTVTGIIDWSDAAIVDPAHDFGLLYRDLGPAAIEAALSGYRTELNDVAAIRKRAMFYARCGVLEDWAYGLETGKDKYVDKSQASMEWLFPR